MQFYTGRTDENLGIPIAVAAGAVTKAAGAYNTIKSLFGKRKKGKHDFAFTRGVFNGGTPRLFRDNESAMLKQAYNIAGGNNLGFDVYEFGRRYLGGNKNKPVTPGNIQTFVSTLSPVSAPVRRATVAPQPVPYRPPPGIPAPVQPTIPFNIGQNMAWAFSRRAGTGRQYSDAEKNALVMRGARIGVSGEQMARIESGMEAPPTNAPKSGIDFTRLLDTLIKPAGAASLPQPAYGQSQPIIINRSASPSQPVSNGISPAIILGGSALLLGGAYLLSRKGR